MPIKAGRRTVGKFTAVWVADQAEPDTGEDQ